MDIRIWPRALNHRPVADGYRWRPHDPQARIDMTQGPARKRRLWTDSPAYASGAWLFSLADYDLFRAWHHLSLDDGARWFRLPVFTGADFVTCLCRFVSAEPSLDALGWAVAFELEVRQVPFLAADADLSARAWLDDLNPRPLRDGYSMTQRPVTRTDINVGPAAAKRWFEDGPITPRLSWSFTPAEFERFRAWYHHGLRDGVAWFQMPVWIGGTYGTRRSRFVDAYEAEFARGVWIVRASLDVSDAPYLDAAILPIAELGISVERAAGMSDTLHRFVHIQYPEAVNGG